jgi:hypothetical protein
MKTYEVEYRRTSYITITVEANSKKEADEKAWQEIEHDRADINDACWELELIQEVENEAG